MDPRTRSDDQNVDARMSLAAWLRAGRDRRKLTIEDVAKITKIQPRILEKLESGQLDGLPAEVFVRGFVRSFAKCVGLDESEAISKYSAAQAAPATPAVAVAKALVDAMARPVEVEQVIEAKRVAQATPSEPLPVAAPVAESPVVETEIVVEAAPVVEASVIEAPAVEAPAVEAAAVDAPVAQAAASEPSRKKRSRKNSKQRARKKKQLQQELAAAAATVDVADAEAVVTSVFEKQSIDTAPVAKIDAASSDVSSIEAKTNEPLTSDASSREDGAVESPSLAEGSQRMAKAAIAAAADEIAPTAPASEAAATDVTASDAAATDASSEVVSSNAAASTDSTASIARDADPGEATAGTWQPTMPPMSTAPSVPWRRPSLPTQTASAYVVPTLVIDDADPDSADREREDRIAKEPHRLSFLPPILLDREDRSARQGGLTLAVIILLIAATLTLSYLMRRPSPSGDGVTMLDGSSMLVG
jgi:transcriptional regulator with XRE-family HTH domain